MRRTPPPVRPAKRLDTQTAAQWAAIVCTILVLVAIIAGAATAASVSPQAVDAGTPGLDLDSTSTPTVSPTVTPTETSTPTATPQVTTGLRAVADTMIYADRPAKNYGSAATVDCGAATNLSCLFLFDLSGIPSNATIYSATLRLYSISQAGPPSAPMTFLP